MNYRVIKIKMIICSVLSGLWTFGKGIGIQVVERDGWKRTVIGALPIINDRKEMAVVSNEPSDIATAGEPI